MEVKGTFDAAHRVVGYPGKCERLHGHTWTVEVRVTGRALDNLGMLVDFRALNQALKETLAPLDHQNLNELPAFRDLNPTAENIAKYIYQALRDTPLLKDAPAVLDSVGVWESAHSCARYREAKA